MKSMTRSEKWVLVMILLLAVLGCIIGYFAWQTSNELADVRMQASDATRQVEMMEARLAKEITPPDLTKMNLAIPPDWQMHRFFADVTMLANEYEIQIHSLTPGEPIQPVPSQEPQEETAGGEDAAELEGESDQTEGTNGETGANDGSDGNVTTQEADQKELFSPEPPISLPGVHTLPLVMEVKGNITEVLAFIDELQHLPRLVWVTGFELLVEDPDQDDNQIYQKPIDLRINLNLYSQAPWDAVEYAEEWPFEIQPAENEEAFDTL